MPSTTLILALPLAQMSPIAMGLWAIGGAMAVAAAVPVVIHLINLLRHRRVKWAAMDFLLAAFKKHRNWVRLKQLLLLLLRMAALAVAVAMLARVKLPSAWTSFFGGDVTHHIVLLDDSYSMAEMVGGETAYDVAKRAIAKLAKAASRQDSAQRFTLIRFSRASLAAGERAARVEPTDKTKESKENGDASSGLNTALLDLSNEAVDLDFDRRLEEFFRQAEVTELSLGPQPAVRLARQVMAAGENGRRVVYLVSDFRRRDWTNTAEIESELNEMERGGAEIHLVRCTSEQKPNLAITALTPSQRTKAAGVPLYVDIEVTNHGPTPARDVPLKIVSRYYDPTKEELRNAGKLKGETDEAPVEMVERLAPGETVRRRAQVYFPGPGKHVVEVALPDDAVMADNRRYCAIDFPAYVPVLLIEGDTTERFNDSYFLEAALKPTMERTMTGARPEVHDPSFLRNQPLDVLKSFQSIYILNVDRLDEQAVNNLKAYLTAGGGVGFFLGPMSDPKFYTGLYDDGQGLFPAPLEREDTLPPAVDISTPDLTAEDHPIFESLSGPANPYLVEVTVSRFFKTLDGWEPPPDANVEILARLRNRKPLSLEKRFGEGRCVAFLAPLTPGWSNWAVHPSSLPIFLQLQDYLGAPRSPEEQRLVGTPITVTLDAERFREAISFFTPGALHTAYSRVGKVAHKRPGDLPLLDVSLGRGGDGEEGGDAGGRSGQTDKSGIYEAWPVTKKGKAKVRRFALNVDPREGATDLIAPDTLQQSLDPLLVEIHLAGEIEELLGEDDYFDNRRWRSAMLAALAVFLIIEQFLAYSASYHPAKLGARTKAAA